MNGMENHISWKCKGEFHNESSNELYDITPIFELDVENDPIIVDYNVKAI